MAWGRVFLRVVVLHLAFAYFSNTVLPSEEYPCQLGKANKAKKKRRGKG